MGSEYSRLYLDYVWLTMTSGLVLIAAVLVLGGVLATAGDRIGMRVGKARLSLFNLRPRQTATLVTIMTGGLISATTLGILFAVSDQLRTGVFELQEIQDDLATARIDVANARAEKGQIEDELDEAISEQAAAQRRLEQINQSLEAAVDRQARTEAQLDQAQDQLGQVEANFRQAQNQLRQISQQTSSLRSEIQQLQTERQELIVQRDQVRLQIAERDREIAERDQSIAERDQAIAEREALLRELEDQRAFLRQEVLTLEREFQGLRQGNVALLRNQPLTSGVLRIVEPTAAPQAVDQLLREANRLALQRIRPGIADTNSQVIQITNAEVEQLINQIRDGREYVVRILSAGNYVVGEPCALAGEACIQVFASAAVNQVVFSQGEIVAATSVDASTMTDDRLIDRINLLIAASQFRARQAGIVADTIQIADGRTETVISFFEQLKSFNQPLDIRAVSSDITYTAGPVRIELVAVRNEQVIFSTAP